MRNKVTGLALLFFLLSLATFAQGVKISTNFPETLTPGQTFDLDVNIEKGSISSFAKLQVDLPLGFTAQPIEVKGGNYTFLDQRIKIVWITVPSDPTFTVKVKLTVPGNAMNTAVITGKFLYIESDAKKEFEMPPHTVKFTESGVSTTTTATTTPTETTTTTPTETTTTTPTETVAATNTVSTTNTTTPTETVTTTPTETATTTPTETVAATNTVSTTNTVTPVETNTVSTTTTNTVATTNTVSTTNTNANTNTTATSGIVYRVQVGAFSSRPNKSRFPGLKEFWIYEDNGLYKATAGKFNSLNEAEAYRSQLKNKGLDAFVVAFQNGVRVKINR